VTRLLLVDDEGPFVRALGLALKAVGYDVATASTGRDGIEQAAAAHPDVVVLDLGLPDMDGVDVLRAVRAWSSAPVIVLSARQDDGAKVAALDEGADDYVTKPFSMAELLARLRATLRRAGPGDRQPVADTPDFRIDLAAKRVTGADGADIRLTPTEWEVVEVLVRNQGRLVSQRQLRQEVCGRLNAEETDDLRVALAAIRRKLEPQPSRPRYFLTELGMGYRFVS
jgi:two-component system KDP operon response regulator KdpE